jgi:hypothetical protein
MKTFVIQLEAHDDLVSARDRLRGVKASRVVLVWPKSGKVLSDYFSLSLLMREADRQGVMLALITKDAEARENARELGIPVFDSLGMAERSRWHPIKRRKIERRPPVGYETLVIERESLHPPLKGTRLHEFGQVVLFLISLLSLGAIALFLVPSAVVKVSLPKTIQEVTFTVQVSPKVSGVNLAGTIPGEVVTLELSGTQTGVSSNKTRVGTVPAEGVITLKNLSTQPLSVPKGTTFLHSTPTEISFISLEDATLTGGVNQEVNIKVVALQAGEEGNLPAGSAFVPQAAWSGNVQALSLDSFGGGVSVDSPSPSEEDYARLREEMMDGLKKQAAASILAGKQDGTTLIPQSLSVLQTSEVRSVEPGLPADHFTLEIKAMFSGLTYRQADVTSLAQSVLVVHLPQGFVPVNETLIVSSSPDIKESAGEYTWEVHARQMVMQQVHEETLSGALTRMPLDQARNVLEANLNLLSPPEITLSPHWWKIMPFTPFRIQVEEQ